MTTANLSQASMPGMPPALRRAQAAIHLPEVQAMLQRLSEFDLGIFMPHRHDELTGDFQPLPDDAMQVESGCKVSFQSIQEIVNQADRFPPWHGVGELAYRLLRRHARWLSKRGPTTPSARSNTRCQWTTDRTPPMRG